MTTALIAAVLAVGGCSEPRESEPELVRSLQRVPSRPPPQIPLARHPLESQADFDALEERVGGRGSTGTLVDVLEELARDAEPGARSKDALLLQRLALLRLRSEEGRKRLRKAFAIAERLRSDAPDSPHTHYLIARITRLLLRKGPDNAFHLDPGQKRMAERLERHWRLVLRHDPDYRGPKGRTADELREDLTALQAAMASMTPPEDEPSKAPPGIEAPRSDLRALRALHELETGERSRRVELCTERAEEAAGSEAEAGGGEPELPDTGVGRWLALRCARLRGEPERVAALLEAWPSGPGRPSAPCRWLRHAGAKPPRMRAHDCSTDEAPTSEGDGRGGAR